MLIAAYYGTRHDINNAGTGVGPAEACAERLRAYAQAGCQTLILGPGALDPAQLETIQKKLVPLLALTPASEFL